MATCSKLVDEFVESESELRGEKTWQEARYSNQSQMVYHFKVGTEIATQAEG